MLLQYAALPSVTVLGCDALTADTEVCFPNRLCSSPEVITELRKFSIKLEDKVFVDAFLSPPTYTLVSGRLVTKSYPALVTPWTVAYQVPLSMEFSRQECRSGLPFPSLGDLPDPGVKLGSPVLQADSSLTEPPGKPQF